MNTETINTITKWFVDNAGKNAYIRTIGGVNLTGRIFSGAGKGIVQIANGSSPTDNVVIETISSYRLSG